MASEKNAVLILLASFNGGKFLEQQLDSFSAQTHEHWNLLVSDDGSSDNTLDILARFQAKLEGRHNVSVVDGPRSGCANNFLSLLKRIPNDSSLVAMSDQDDVWLPEKLGKRCAAPTLTA